MTEAEDPTRNPAELPPFLNTWRKMYIAVLVHLALLILLFYAFTRYFE